MKRRAVFALFLLLCVLLSSCKEGLPLTTAPFADEEEELCGVLFYQQRADKPSEFLSEETLVSYRGEHEELESDVYFNSMDETEQVLYRAMQYAQDHRYIGLIFSEALIDKGAKDDISKVLVRYSLSTPLLEQNLYFGVSDELNTYRLDRGLTPFLFSSLTGYELVVENFAEEYAVKREEALAAAKKIKFGFSPEDDDEVARAHAFYRYLGEQITYEEQSGRDYLYDAFVTGKTNCDGIANAFSLLCALEGIECFEKYYSPLYGAGHTWNTVKLDEKWYNVDATYSKEALRFLEEEQVYVPFFFGFSNEMELNSSSGGAPRVTENLIAFAGEYRTLTMPSCAEAVIDLFSEGEEVVSLVVEKVTENGIQLLGEAVYEQSGYEFGCIYFSHERNYVDVVYLYLA